MTYRSEYSYSKTLSQIDSIKEDFVRLSGYASQLTEIDPSIICQPKAVKRIKDIQRFLKFIEGIFYELRSMFEIGDDTALLELLNRQIVLLKTNLLLNEEQLTQYANQNNFIH
ncbi:MAG: hypothetical protein CVU46_18875 [Chloroflexi bacterium HGW-Chloroflexi-8]|nr:MAG: hypothetical protein CVU46_18875 [Chloroflexi bacterium HGW-Chloroflexi-8]